MENCPKCGLPVADGAKFYGRCLRNKNAAEAYKEQGLLSVWKYT